MTTEAIPVMGDLELEEIMSSLGDDFKSTPVPPKAKPEVVEPVADIPDVEVPDLDAMEETVVEAPPAEVPETKAEPAPLTKVEVDDPELQALLDSVPDTAGDEMPDEIAAAHAGDEAIDADAELGEEFFKDAVVTAPTESVVEKLAEAKVDSLASIPKITADAGVISTSKLAASTITTEDDDDAILSSPYEDDEDWKPITKGGVTYYIDPARLKRDVAFSPASIDEAMTTHASMYVFYGVQQSKARGQYERTKAAFEILESRLDNEHRLALKEENPKTTEAQIRAAVVSDKRWSKGNARLIETRGIYDLATVALEAFSQRRDTLLQMAKTLREEHGSRMRLEEIREGTKASADAVIERMKKKTTKELGSEATQV